MGQGLQAASLVIAVRSTSWVSVSLTTSALLCPGNCLFLNQCHCICPSYPSRSSGSSFCYLLWFKLILLHGLAMATLVSVGNYWTVFAWHQHWDWLVAFKDYWVHLQLKCAVTHGSWALTPNCVNVRISEQAMCTSWSTETCLSVAVYIWNIKVRRSGLGLMVWLLHSLKRCSQP